MKKRILSFILATLLIISCLPSVVVADVYGNLEFVIAQNDQIGNDGKSIEYANGYKLSVTYNGIGDNNISSNNGHTELRNIPDGVAVTFTLSIPESGASVPDLILSGARESFTDNTFTRTLDFSQSNVISVNLDFGNNPGPGGPGNPPDMDDGDVRFMIDKSDVDVVQYSIDGTTWTSVANNDVVKADAISGATTIYVKAVPGEGRKLDDYIDNNISVNQYRIDGTPTALDFTNDVASFAYDTDVQIEVVVRFMDDHPGPGGPGNPPDMDDGDVRFMIDKSDADVVQYSIDGTTWTSVANNDVVKADAISGATTIYVKAVPGEGRKLDDYIDNNISVNQYRIDGTPTALDFTNDVASFAYINDAKIEVVVRFMNGQPDPGGEGSHIVKIQINNNDGANGSVQCKFDTDQGFATYTVANYDNSGNIKLEIPENASTITFKAIPDAEYSVQDCTILHDDQDIDETKAYMDGVTGDGYEYSLPDDDKTIVFRAEFGNKLVSWNTVSWSGGNVQIENGQVEAYAVHVGDKTYDKSVAVADETNKLYPLSDITGLDIQTHNVSYSDTDLFISEYNTEEVSIDFRFVPDYGYQVTDIIATEGSVMDQFDPGMEISTFNFVYVPLTNVHFIVKFTSTEDIINNQGNIVSDVAIADGENAISSGNLKMNIADVDSADISDGLKDEVGENDAQYLDMTLSQVVSKGGNKGNWENPLTELDGNIDVSLTVSDLDPDGEYYIIREHINGSGDAVYDEISVDYDPATSIITFATDKFSTYALVKKAPAKPHTHDNITFMPWDGGANHNSMPTEAGSYYLASDITLTEAWSVPSGTINLCLNGHVIKQTASTSVIKVGIGATLNLYDCGTDGTITGGITDIGGGVYVSYAGTFNMYGGNITGNTATGDGGGGVYIDRSGSFTMIDGTIAANTATSMFGGGVYIDGSFTMNGGSIDHNSAVCGGGVCVFSGNFTMNGGSIDHNSASSGGGVYNWTIMTVTGTSKITDNSATSLGAGVYVYNREQSKITVGGSANITGNMKESGGSKTANDVYLPNGKYITLGTVSNGMQIGVTTATAPVDGTPVQITTNGASTDKDYFKSDNDAYVIAFNTDHLELTVPHVHSFVYTASNGKLTATCKDGCTEGYDTTPLTLTLTAPTNLVYDGNPKSITFADDEATAWTGAGLDLPTVTYAAKSGSSLTNDKAVDAGSYTASITVDTNKTANLEFEITKVTPYIKSNPAPSDIIYGKKLADSTLAGGYVQVSSTDSTQIAGLFEWSEPNTVPAIADSDVTLYSVTFTPADEKNYNAVSCKVTITVNHTHNPVKVDGQPATVTASGWKDYYECACGDLFEDANGTTPIKDLEAWKAEGGAGYIAKLPVPEKYTVTFDMGGHGTAPAAQNVEKGKTATKPADPTASGWTFGGWYTDATYKVTFDFDTAITTDTTIYAKWTEVPTPPVSYTVTFDMGGHGTQIPSQTVESGSKATKPSDPTDDSWTFLGWFADPELTTTFDFSAPITADTTVYAKWFETYFFKAGAAGTWTVGSEEDYEMIVKRNVADETCFSHFVGVEVDGELLTLGVDYDAKQGSTIITFKASYLKKLSVGDHKVRIIFDDGSVITYLRIKPSNGNGGNGSGKIPTPPTDDNTKINLWITLMCISGAAFVGIVICGRRRKSDA